MFQNYIDCLLNNVYRAQQRFKSYNHHVYAEEMFIDRNKDLKTIIIMFMQKKLIR